MQPPPASAIRIVCLLGVVALTAACASTGAVPKPFPMPAARAVQEPPAAQVANGSEPLPDETAVAVQLVSTAMMLRGAPYRSGGADPAGFDCSGFTQYVFARYGLALPKTVRDQFQAGESIGSSEIVAGDLVFFSTTTPGASHVGIALDSESFIHAPSSTGVVRVERLSATYWSRRYLGARRIAPPASGIPS